MRVCEGYTAADEETLAKTVRDSCHLHETNLIKTFTVSIQDTWHQAVFQGFVKKWPILLNSNSDLPQFAYEECSEVWPFLPGSSPAEQFDLLWFECLYINRKPFIDVNRLLQDHRVEFFTLSNCIIAAIVEQQCRCIAKQKRDLGIDTWQPNEAAPWIAFNDEERRTIRDNIRDADHFTQHLPHPQFTARRIDPLLYKAARGINKGTPSPRSMRRMAPVLGSRPSQPVFSPSAGRARSTQRSTSPRSAARRSASPRPRQVAEESQE